MSRIPDTTPGKPRRSRASETAQVSSRARRSVTVMNSACLDTQKKYIWLTAGWPRAVTAPGAPTDPDLRDSRIRLLGLRARCATVDAVNDARGEQGVETE